MRAREIAGMQVAVRDVSVHLRLCALGFSLGQIQNELSGPELSDESYFVFLHQKPVLA